MPSTFEENLEKSGFQEAWQYAIETARRKAREVAERLKVDYTHKCFNMLVSSLIPRPISSFPVLHAEKNNNKTLAFQHLKKKLCMQ